MSDRLLTLITRGLCGAAAIGLLVAGVGSSSLAAESPAGGASARGAKTYGQYCAACHGANLVHPSGNASYDLRTFPVGRHDRFINSVLNGKGAMPPWEGTITNAQAEDLWAYVSTSTTRAATAAR